ncbi:MAG: CapA family protein [Bacteroidota bacterium]
MKRVYLALSYLFLIQLSTLEAQADSNYIHELNMIFVGDIMGHGPQIKSAEVIKDSIYNYKPCFEYVAPIIQEADLAIGNLELTLPGKGPYSGYPRFRSPDQIADALQQAGFDLLVTANNHSNDGNKIGVENTIKTLRSRYFYQTGTFLNQLDRDVFYPLIVYKGVFKIAFLNYTYGTNGLPTPAPTIVNLIDEDQIKADLETARQLEPDFIIVLMHWGYEYQINENKEQKALSKKIFEWGGDLIVGAHPHVVQPVKKISVSRPDSSVYEGVVAYSLGNFISNQRKTLTDLGLMFDIKLEKNLLTNKTHLVDHSYIPVYRHIETPKSGKRTYRVLPISTFESEQWEDVLLNSSTRKAMQATAKKIRAHLAKFDSRERIVSLPQHLIEQE